MAIKRSTKANWLLIVYLILAAIELWGEYSLNASLIIMSKPLLMLPLVVWVFVNTAQQRLRLTYLIFIGLNCSIIGDASLIVTEQKIGTLQHQELAFLIGLGAFLLTHLCYMIAFLLVPQARTRGLIRRSKGFILLPLIGLYVGLMSLLWSHLGDMRIPVIIYAAIIVLMTASAANLKGLIHQRTLQIALGAAILFMFSDSIIALTTFRDDLFFQHSRLLIMIPYLASQAFFAWAAIRLNQSANVQLVEKTQ